LLRKTIKATLHVDSELHHFRKYTHLVGSRKEHTDRVVKASRTQILIHRTAAWQSNTSR